MTLFGIIIINKFIKHIKLIEVGKVMYTCDIVCGEFVGTGAVPL